MKKILEYLSEALISSNFHIFKFNMYNIEDGLELEDKLKSFLRSNRKRYSLTNKTECIEFFNAFYKEKGIRRNILKNFNVESPEKLAKLIIDNHDEMVNAGWKFDRLKNFDLTKLEQDYESWKAAGGQSGKDFDPNAKPSEDERIVVIYDVNNPKLPETTKEYTFKGKMGKDTAHEINMMKVDWKYMTGKKYYDARPILLTNYLKKSDDELKAVVFDVIGQDD